MPSKYNFNNKEPNKLPINESKVKILTAIRDNPVVVLQGDTGCGKTTQVPQFILDDAYNRQEYCNIVCTQPRRIAAISIANRVCAERKWDVGSVVGYQAGLHANASEDTRLLYCTTGVLLQKLIKTKTMAPFTHIVLDEVHERDQDMDFLLVIIRQFLTTVSRNVKVILMSATIDTNKFSEYFKIVQGKAFVPAAPVIKIDTRRLYTVTEYYLDELMTFVTENDKLINYEKPGISDEMYKVCLKLIILCSELAGQYDFDTFKMGDYKPSVLVFLPGINEIDKMEKELQRLTELTKDIKILCIRLHSMVSPDEQKLVFRKAPKDYIKVILATNIAESSITVSDVKYVIDFCLTKYLVTDTSTNLTSILQLNWASRSNCKQRAGRAGRVMNGRVYRLVSKFFYLSKMPEHISPEMIRCPLANIVLKAKLLDMGAAPHTILALAMDPPNLSDIRNTILKLKEVGALYKTAGGKYEELDGDLSYVGRIMADLPIDIHTSRLIIFGYLFSVFDEAIIIEIALSPNNHEVHIYHKEDNEWKLIETLNQHDLRVMGIDWGRTTNRIVTCAVDRNAYVWTQDDGGKWKPMLVLLRINRAATCVKWSPLENKFAAGSGDRLVSVSYFESSNNWWVSKHIKKPIRSTVTCIDWHPNNSLLVVGSTDYKVRIFSGYIKDIEDQPSPNSWGNRMPFGQLLAEFQNTSAGGGWIHNVSFSHDGTRICWVGHDSSVNIADSNNGNAVTKIKTEYLPFLCCEWISSNAVVVAGHSCIPLVYVIDKNSNKLILTAKLDQTQKKESSNISAMRIFQSLDRHLRPENTDISLDSIHQNAITCIRIHTDDKSSCKRISTSGLDGQVVIWDINTKLMQGLKI